MSSHIESAERLSPDVVALVERIPLFAEAGKIHVAPLENVISLNNANFRVQADSVEYVLRVASDDARWLGVRRDEEFAAMQSAAAIGIAPPVLYAEPEGHFLTPFIHGRHWKPEEFREPINLHRVAETLCKLHQVTGLPHTGSMYQRIERLMDSATELGQPLPPNLADFRTRMRDIELMRQADPRFTPGLAHNDFWANNFLDDGAQLWLLDWEFAGWGDGFLDLATTSYAGGYDAAQEVQFLDAYGGELPADLAILHAMKFIVSFFEAGWALVLHGLRGSSDFNYARHAQQMWQRMEELFPQRRRS